MWLYVANICPYWIEVNDSRLKGTTTHYLGHYSKFVHFVTSFLQTVGFDAKTTQDVHDEGKAGEVERWSKWPI